MTSFAFADVPATHTPAQALAARDSHELTWVGDTAAIRDAIPEWGWTNAATASAPAIWQTQYGATCLLVAKGAFLGFSLVDIDWQPLAASVI